MLLVKTSVGKSTIEGLGLFAEEFIPNGSHIWKFHDELDVQVYAEKLESMPDLIREYFLHYAYKTNGTYILCSDNGKFFNHADSPNTSEIEDPDTCEGITIANKDIEMGEELTCNYYSFDRDALSKLSRVC